MHPKKTRQDNLYFLTTKDLKTAYIVIDEDQWKYGTRKEYKLEGFATTPKSEISVLGHNGIVLEYQKDVDPSPHFTQKGEDVEISVMRAQRIYNDKKWNNPIVVKLTELSMME